MRTRHWFAVITLAIGLAMPAAAWAQPRTKLVDGLSQEAIAGMWCSAILLEKSFWYEEGAPLGIYYDAVSLELETIALAVMEAQGWSQERQEALWETYDGVAFDMAENDAAAFAQGVRECEAGYGHLAPHPKK